MGEIVFIDDDNEILALHHKYFSKEGYLVREFTSPGKALGYLEQRKTDCVILDVMMPEMDGFTLCKKLRTFSDVPVIFLTGKTDEMSKVEGLLLGAEDYVEKPYSMKELSARIYVQIRKKHALEFEQIKTFSSFKMDITKHKLFYGDEQEVALTNREFDLLLYFVMHPLKIVTFEELGCCLWGRYEESDRRSIMVNMSRLRKKLQDYVDSSRIIETIWANGYKFIAV